MANFSEYTKVEKFEKIFKYILEVEITKILKIFWKFHSKSEESQNFGL